MGPLLYSLSYFQNKLSSKRHAPITFDGKSENGKEEEKKTKNSTEQKIYSPPSGKYSAKVQNYGNNQNNRQRSRNSGGGGGGGSYRNRRNFKKY